MPDLTIRLSLIDGVSDALKEINGKMENAAKDWKENFGALSKNLQVVGAGMVAIGGSITAALGLSLNTFVKAGEELDLMSIKTGIAVETLSGWKYAAEQTGTSLDAITTGMRNLGTILTTASQGGKEATQSLAELGLNVQDLMAMSPEQRFLAVADALSRIEDPTIRSGEAVKILGRSALDLLPLIAQGRDGIKEFTDEAERLGIVMDQESADKAKAFAESIKALKESFTGLQQTIGPLVADILKPLVDKITDIIVKVREWMDAHPGLTKALVDLGLAMGVVLTFVGSLLVLVPVIATAWTTLNMVFIATPIGAIITGIVAIIAAGVLLVSHWKEVTEFFQTKLGVIVASFVPFIGIPMLIYANWGKIQEFFKEMWNQVQIVFLGAVEKILSGLDKLLGWIPGFGDKIKQAHDAVANMIDSAKISLDADRAAYAASKLAKANDELQSDVEESTAAIEKQGVVALHTADELETLADKIDKAFAGTEYQLSPAGKLNLNFDDVIAALTGPGGLGHSLDEVKAKISALANPEDINAILNAFQLTAEGVNNQLISMGLRIDATADDINSSLTSYQNAEGYWGKMGVTINDLRVALASMGWTSKEIEAYEKSLGKEVDNLAEYITKAGIGTDKWIAKLRELGLAFQEVGKGSQNLTGGAWSEPWSIEKVVSMNYAMGITETEIHSLFDSLLTPEEVNKIIQGEKDNGTIPESPPEDSDAERRKTDLGKALKEHGYATGYLGNTPQLANISEGGKYEAVIPLNNDMSPDSWGQSILSKINLSSINRMVNQLIVNPNININSAQQGVSFPKDMTLRATIPVTVQIAGLEKDIIKIINQQGRATFGRQQI